MSLETSHEQECIPVGCFPPAAVAVPDGGLHQAPPPPPEEAHPREEATPPRRKHPPGGSTPPVNRMTNRCKNITLPQTSFTGGKN